MNWIVIRALNKLYNIGVVKLNQTINSSPVFRHHEQAGEVVYGRKTLSIGTDYKSTYENLYLEDYQRYHNFLEENNLLSPQLRFEQTEIELLIKFHEGLMDGSFKKLKSDLIEAQESVRGFSLMFFKNDKYLEKKPSLVKAITEILRIKLVDNKSQQYLYILQCLKPKLIILCENANFLNRDKLPRLYGYELWYAGGRNIPKLKYSQDSRKGLDIYYSCDWDKDGLEIFELAKREIPDLKLLYPDGISRSIVTTEHKSHWKFSSNPEALSGLTANLYNEKEKRLIKKLITDNHWVTEEGNNLKTMIDSVKQKD